MSEAVHTTPPEPVPQPTAEEKKKAKDSQAQKMLKALEATADLWESPCRERYVTVPARGHAVHLEVGSDDFRRWVGQRYHEETKKLPPATFARQVAEHFAGLERELITHEVFTRVARVERTLYLDLRDEALRVVRCTGEGWEVIPGADAPVKFLRPPVGMALPAPVKGGAELEALRRFVNVEDGDWPLVVGWLLAAMLSREGYPILALCGEQGTGKTVSARYLKQLIDPGATEESGFPKLADFALIASRHHVVSFGNLDTPSKEVLNELCRISTGGSAPKRVHYSDTNVLEVTLSRPMILGGIGRFLTRADIVRRLYLLDPPRLKECAPRITLDAAFEQLRPGILASLLDRVCVALRRFDAVKSTYHGADLGRGANMLDATLWTLAALDDSSPISADSYLEALQASSEAGNEAAIEDNPMGQALLAHFSHLGVADPLRGSAQEVMNLLGAAHHGGMDTFAAHRDWPTGPVGAANMLRRIRPPREARGWVAVYRKPVRTHSRQTQGGTWEFRPPAEFFSGAAEDQAEVNTPL